MHVKIILIMFVKKIKNRSINTSVIVSEKIKGKYRQLATIGISSDESEISEFVEEGKLWIRKKELSLNPELDFFGEERQAQDDERRQVQEFLSRIDNVLINGTQLILDRVFDSIGFNEIEDNIFRQLVLSRLSYPSSKAATVEYLKNHFDEDVDLSKIYRYYFHLIHHQKLSGLMFVDDIIGILNCICKRRSLSYMFLPIGGMHFIDVKVANEDGFIEINSSGLPYLFPVRSLTFYSFGNNSEWIFFCFCSTVI